MAEWQSICLADRRAQVQPPGSLSNQEVMEKTSLPENVESPCRSRPTLMVRFRARLLHGSESQSIKTSSNNTEAPFSNHVCLLQSHKRTATWWQGVPHFHGVAGSASHLSILNVLPITFTGRPWYLR